jgi:hypothetical protein
MARRLARELAIEGAAPEEVVCSDDDSVRQTVALGGDDFRNLTDDHPRDTTRLRPLLPTLPKHADASGRARRWAPSWHRTQWRTEKKISVGAKYMSGGFSLANSNNFGIFHTNIQRFYNNSKI